MKLQDIPDQQIHDEIAARSMEPLTVTEIVYIGHGDYDLMEIDFPTSGDELCDLPFPPPETHL